MATQVSKKKRMKGWRGLVVAIGGLFILTGAVIGILNIQGVLQGRLSDIIALIVFPALGLLIALCAWLFPAPPDVSAAQAPLGKDAQQPAQPPFNFNFAPNISVAPNINVSPDQHQSVQLLSTDAPSFPGSTQSNQISKNIPLDKRRGDQPVLPDPNVIFQFNAALTDPGEFYGRLSARATLISRTRKGASTSIVGPRRMGKSWLMHYLHLVAPRELGSNYRLGFLDASSPRSATVSGFTSRALEELGNAVVGSANIGLDTLEQVIKDLRLRNQVPVLCIDEFEGLCNQQEFSESFFTELRAIEQAGLVLVVASKERLITMVSKKVQTSPFFNVFEQLTLQPFSLKEAERFIQEKSAQSGFTEQEQKYLLEYGRQDGQQWLPLRLQLAGKMLLEDKNRSITEDAHYYRPNELDYQRDFEKRLEEIYQGVVGK